VVGRRFTDDELRQIEAMLKEGLPVREMAKKLRRSRASVKNFCYRKKKIKF
jgi:IS30 family transposase